MINEKIVEASSSLNPLSGKESFRPAFKFDKSNKKEKISLNPLSGKESFRQV